MDKHTIEPIYDSDCKALVLGSFPSVVSRQAQFYYANPQNRFWRVISAVYTEPVPETDELKRSFLLRHGIALWDVIAVCDIEKSADSAIKNVIPNDLDRIFGAADIHRVYLNGRTAEKYYKKYFKTAYPEALCLPSTSPANAAWTLEKLTAAWSLIRTTD